MAAPYNDITSALSIIHLRHQLDKRVLVQLRDERLLVGVLRSFDQYANLILQDTYERFVEGNLYSDIPLGLYVVRGDFIVFIGEVGDESKMNEKMIQVSQEEIIAAKEQAEHVPRRKPSFDFGDV